MTVLLERAEPITDERASRRTAARLLGGWLPGALTVVALAVWVHAYEVSVRDILAFSGYLLLGTQNAPADGLDRVATLRFADGSVAIYELPSA